METTDVTLKILNDDGTTSFKIEMYVPKAVTNKWMELQLLVLKPIPENKLNMLFYQVLREYKLKELEEEYNYFRPDILDGGMSPEVYSYKKQSIIRRCIID